MPTGEGGVQQPSVRLLAADGPQYFLLFLAPTPTPPSRTSSSLIRLLFPAAAFGFWRIWHNLRRKQSTRCRTVCRSRVGHTQRHIFGVDRLYRIDQAFCAYYAFCGRQTAILYHSLDLDGCCCSVTCTSRSTAGSPHASGVTSLGLMHCLSA